MDERARLRDVVALMRELGVVSFDGITLGPAPHQPAPEPPPETPEEAARQKAAAERERLETQLGRPISDHEYDTFADPANLR